MLNLKKTLTNILDGLKKEIIVADFGNSAVQLTSGTVGLWITNQTVNVAKTGYDIIGVSMILHAHPSAYYVSLYARSGSVYLNFYRSNPNAYSVPANDVTFRVIYKKQ